MAIARSKLLDLSYPGWLHCTSRCVRRAFLFDDGFDHRRAWLEDRLCFLARCFALETAGYAVMANHMHVIIRMRPDIVSSWSAEDLIANFEFSAFKRDNVDLEIDAPKSDEIDAPSGKCGVCALRSAHWAVRASRADLGSDLGRTPRRSIPTPTTVSSG
jgi:hypothetical protein